MQAGTAPSEAAVTRTKSPGLSRSLSDRRNADAACTRKQTVNLGLLDAHRLEPQVACRTAEVREFAVVAGDGSQLTAGSLGRDLGTHSWLLSAQREGHAHARRSRSAPKLSGDQVDQGKSGVGVVSLRVVNSCGRRLPAVSSNRSGNQGNKACLRKTSTRCHKQIRVTSRITHQERVLCRRVLQAHTTLYRQAEWVAYKAL